jgi:hypothetical protein
VTFALNPGFRILRVGGRDVAGHSDSATADKRRVTMRLAPSTRAQRELEIEYEGVPRFGSDSINGISASWVELGLNSFWHPVIDDFANPLQSRVTVPLPQGWQLVSSGDPVRRGDVVEVRNDVALLDVPLSASPAFNVARSRRAAIYHFGADTLRLPKLLAMADACGDYLDTRYGATASLTNIWKGEPIIANVPAPDQYLSGSGGGGLCPACGSTGGFFFVVSGIT